MLHYWIGSDYWCNVFVQTMALDCYDVLRSVLWQYCLTQNESNCKLLTVYNQEKFNKKPDHIAQLLKPFKENNLIDIFQIKKDDSEYTREEYMLNEKGAEVAYNIIGKWLPNESIYMIEYIAKIHRLLVLALNLAYLT